MSQKHYQQTHGIFHLTTNTKDAVPWCTYETVPMMLIEHLCKTRDVYEAQLFAFCILPNHLHCILCPGPRGISRFMQSFKSNSTKDIRERLRSTKIAWQQGFHDERIRDDAQRSAVVAYVQGNGMKHGLVKEIMDWPWTSLHFPSHVNPMDIW